MEERVSPENGTLQDTTGHVNRVTVAIPKPLSSQEDPEFKNSNGSTRSSAAFHQEELLVDHGEVVRSATSGALSAPPPPGFDVPLLPVERTHKVNQLLWNEPTTEAASHGNALAADVASYGHVNSKRTTSFTNLAAVLGTGLAESMDDATRDQQRGGRDWAGTELEGQQSALETFDPTRVLSYTRQSRHAASRMIGTSSRSTLGAIGPGGSSSSSEIPLSRGESAGRNQTLNSEQSVLPGRVAIEHRPLDLFARTTDRNLPPKDLGLTVMEPGSDGRRTSAPPSVQLGGRTTASGSPLSQRSNFELEHGMQRLSMGDEGRRDPSPFLETGIDESGSRPLDVSQLRTESELLPFIWDVSGTEPSRALVILRSSLLYIPDIRTTCEAFGVLETFRSDFSDYGIIFVCYFDIRSAQYAALELQSCLKRLASQERPAGDVRVQYCVPLNASSANDESIIHLSEVPPGVTEDMLSSVLSSYGAVRSLRRQTSAYGGGGYAVEFHNIQDARQALMELESTQPWGSDLIVEVGARSQAIRRRGRELLALIGKWRQAMAAGRNPSDRSSATLPVGGTAVSGGVHLGGMRSPSSSSSSPAVAAPEPPATYGQYNVPGAGQASLDDTSSSSRSQSTHQTTQLVLGPDGRYSYMVVNHTTPYHPGHSVEPNVQAMAPQHIVHGAQQPTYVTHGHAPSPGGHLASHHTAPGQPHAVHYWQQAAPAQHQFHHPVTAVVSHHVPSQYPPGANPSAVPYYAHVQRHLGDSSVSSGSVSNPALGVSPRRVVASLEEKDNRHLMLDIEGVETGRDTRTSLMIRNIPNKYTQHMLLSELAENGHGPGKIDFFYLPIDFKNRCNRGYAFVNFVDYRDILPFHREYSGQHWRVFNSDKICDITYARIQGKSGMLKRFENSALMEKDDEYKPLVFVSHGVDKGKRLPFP